MPRKRRLHLNWPFLAASLATIFALGLLVVWRSTTRTSHRDISDVEWQLALVASCSETVVAAWFLSTGASIGSFLNVVAWRLPRGVSLLIPSRCSHCNTRLSLQDNLPVFGWLKLRGRCSTCRLPIDARYLWVELLLLAVFGWTFFNEYLSLGGNLPTQPFKQAMSLEDRLLKTTFGLQIFLYLWVESGLIVVALMTLQKSTVPWRVFFWTALPCVILPVFAPSLIQVSWRPAGIESVNHDRFEGLITVACGMAIGVAISMIVSLVTDQMLGVISLEGQRTERTCDHHQTLHAGFAVAGGLLGWQAVVVVALITLVLAWVARAVLSSRLLPNSLLGWRDNICAITSLSSWIWLGVLIYRSTWIYWSRLPFNF